MKSLIELQFQHEDVFRSTLSYPNETSKECIQFLNKVCISTMNYVSSNPTGGRGDINTKHHLVPIYLITDIYCLGFQK
jgi:hypothetical protein